MIVGFVLVLSIVGISLATALYSNFLPYLSLLRDIKDYNMAYYAANTAIERSLLVLRYQEAGFEGTGGWNKNTVIGDTPVSDQGYFGYYNNETTLQRSIVSRPVSDTIPGSAKGNIDVYLLSGGSNDWNVLDYNSVQRIPFRVDVTESYRAYVHNINIKERQYFTGGKIGLLLSLNPIVKEKFSSVGGRQLQTLQDGNGDGVANDIVVDWSWKGSLWQGMFMPEPEFSILPRSLVGSQNSTSVVADLSDDESIREEVIVNLENNSGAAILFSNNMNPLYRPSDPLLSIKSAQKDNHLMINDSSLNLSGISGLTFDELLDPSNNIQDQELSFFLINHLLADSYGIYPFLQYKINFSGIPNTISQPYFFVNGKGQVGDYTVQMNIKKSINKDETLGSFTVVF